MSIQEKVQFLTFVLERGTATATNTVMQSRGRVLFVAVAVLALACPADAFLAQLRLPSFASKAQLCLSKQARQGASVSLRMGYLDGLAKKDDSYKEALKPNTGHHANDAKLVGALMPDADYTGFIDAIDGFDGGDGQVGVVGDGSNAMETFDNREVIQTKFSGEGSFGNKNTVDNQVGGRGKVSGGTIDGRVDKRWNAWGSDETDVDFQQDLINRGLIKINPENGEDRLKVQRQQYENWYKQRKTWANEKAVREQMEIQTEHKRQRDSDDYKNFLDTGKDNVDDNNDNVIFATGAKGIDNSEILKKSDWKPCAAGTRIDGEFEIMGNGLCYIILEPNSMVQEQFIARFTPDTNEHAWVVAETGYDLGSLQCDGQLPRRGKEKEFTIRFKPPGPLSEPMIAWLVVDAEDGWKWTYKITGRT